MTRAAVVNLKSTLHAQDCMSPQVRADFTAGECELRANGRAVNTQGYLEAWSDAYSITRRHAREAGQAAEGATLLHPM